jgi:hypothetical protein
MPVTIGKGGSTVEVRTTDVKTTNVQTQNQSIRVNNDVKLNNNPVNKVQAQNSQQNNRAQFAINRIVSGGGNNVRQSMNQSPSMNGGNDHRGSFLH